MQSPIGSATQMGLATVAPATAAPATPVSMEKESFLKLLVAQMSNQDPLSPGSSDQYMQQSTQFSSLEQLMNLNQGVDGLALGVLSANSQLAVGLVGRTVVAQSDQVDLQAEGDVEFEYRLGGEARSVTVHVYNAEGDEVATIDQRRQAAGSHTVRWDGQDNDGQRLPEGTYRISVEAAGEDGDPIAVDTFLRGEVSAIRFDGPTPELKVGDRTFHVDEVIEVE